MFNATDDDDFFTPTSSASNLANLFSGPPHIDTAASLIYTAPKQPPRVDAVDGKVKPKAQIKTICVKTVHLFKLVEATYTSQGKHGLAIIGDPELNTYDLLLYKTRTNITASIKINPGFIYTHSKDHCTFKDPQLNFWRVHFENSKDDLEFFNMLESKGANVVKHQDTEDVVAVEEGKSVEQEGTLSDGSQARADILVRISKVGQSMLPTVKNPDLSESEPDEVVKTKKVVRKPKRHSTSDKDNFHTTDIPEQNNVPQYMVPVQQQYMLGGGQYMAPNQMVPCQMMAINDPLAIHFSENRTHNSEVRMNLSQLSNKLDTVLNELNFLRVTVPPSAPVQSETSFLHGKVEELERKLLGLTSGDKLQEEVDRLNGELEVCRSEELVLKQRVQELSDEVERRVKSEEEKSKVIAEQCLLIKNFEMVKSELDDSREMINSLKENVMNLKRTVELQTVELKDKTGLESTVQNLKSTVEEQEAMIKTQRDKLDELEESKEESVKVFAEVIKGTMNMMYQNILEKCGEDSDFRKVLSHNMKSTTFQIIQDYKKNVMERWVKRADEINPPPVPEFEVTV